MATIQDALRPTTTEPERPTVERVCPRETMRVLPRPFQLPLTLLTGKPYAGQRPLRMSRTYHLAMSLLNMSVGVAVSSLALVAGGWWLVCVLPGWAITLHGMRNLRMMIYHQCAHRNMYARRRLDAAIGRLAASLLLVQNFDRYSDEHVSDHHALHHMTLRDPTVQAFLLSLDLHPGMTRRQMWRRLSGKLISPKFHTAFVIGRLRSFLHGSSTAEKLTALALYVTGPTVAGLTGRWLIFVVAWLVPLFPLFQVSNTLRLCVKHTFPDPLAVTRKGRQYFASLTNAIFLGEAAPTATESRPCKAVGWLRWTARMLLVHFPARYLVLTGDTVCHDFHHRHPRTREWANYIFARQRDALDGHRGWPPYREAWGLTGAINLVFDSLSAADPHEFDVSKVRSVSKRELFAAFDD